MSIDDVRSGAYKPKATVHSDDIESDGRVIEPDTAASAWASAAAEEQVEDHDQPGSLEDVTPVDETDSTTLDGTTEFDPELIQSQSQIRKYGTETVRDQGLVVYPNVYKNEFIFEAEPEE